MTLDARVPPSPPDLRRRLGIETPEHIRLYVELAGLGSRTAAALVDISLLTLALLGAVVTVVLLRVHVPGMVGSWAIAVLYLVVNFLILAYFGLFEALAGGRTPGKRLIGLRVVMDDGRPLTPAAATLRTLVRLVDMFFPLLPFLPGMIAIAAHPHHKRLGDLAAGTLVVRDRATDWELAAVVSPTDDPLEVGPPRLSDAEYRLLGRLLGRLDEVEPMIAARLARDLAARLDPRVPRRARAPVDYLTEVLAEEQQRRRGRFATRAHRGAVDRTAIAAERFVARKQESWRAFHQLAKRLERTGLAGLPAEEIPRFAAAYREVAADLARAQTYDVDPAVIEYLERLVGAGHNSLYQARGRARPRIADRLLREFPAAVVRSWRYVAVASALFVAPAAVGYRLLREQPELATTIVSPLLTSRAEEAAERQARGLGYAEEDATLRPQLAALLISNNVRVCFYVFTGGLLAGIWTVLVLLLNGFSVGTAFGLFANYDAMPYLLTFVAGHGVLEFTAIFVSAAAGLRLAHAIIVPGDLTRKDALVSQGRIAAPMIGAVICLLVVAGMIEGLLSASDASTSLKVVVSGASVVLLGLYFWNGGRAVARQ